jgi:hypothetical protein
MIRVTWFFICFCIYLYACKHTNKDSIIILKSDFKYVTIGDSVPIHISGGDGTFYYSLTPNMGMMNQANWYVAPKSIATDSIQVQIQLNDMNSNSSVWLTVIRANKIDSTISFSKHILPLFEANCNFKACHGQNDAAGNVNLENHAATRNHVLPFKPQNSLLYLSLIKSDPLRRMPPSGPLHQYKTETVFKWIEQGCLNN